MAQIAVGDLAAHSPVDFTLRLATIPDDFVATCEGDPCSTSTKGNAGLRAPISCNHSRDRTAYPQADVQVPRASFEDPYERSAADLHPCSTYSHSSTQFRADSTGFPQHDPSCQLCHAAAHLRSLNAGCAVSRDEPLSEREEQGQSKGPCAPGEEYLCSQVDSDKENALPKGDYVCSPHVTIEVQEPLVHSSTASPHLFEDESSWQHEERGDSTEPGGSLDNYLNLHAGHVDACDNQGVTHDQILRRGAASIHPTDYGQEPCLSECSSAISMVTYTSSEITSTSMDYSERHWTDAKHGSYLNYMETNFVKSLYGSEYCALDVCGQRASKGSPTLSDHLFKFKCWQSGDWCRRSMLKPPLPGCIPLALRSSPWVDHFRHRDYPHAYNCIRRRESPNTSYAMDEEEEVNSPALEPNKGDRSRLPPSRSKTEELFGQDGSAGNGDGSCGLAHDTRKGRDGRKAMGLLEQKGLQKGRDGHKATGLLEQKGLQGFGHGRQESMLLNMKKRGFESGLDLEPSVKCKRS